MRWKIFSRFWAGSVSLTHRVRLLELEQQTQSAQIGLVATECATLATTLAAILSGLNKLTDVIHDPGPGGDRELH